MVPTFLPEVKEKIELINSVFDKLEIPRLMKNPDFVIWELSIDFLARFNFKKENCIPINIDCDIDGIQIGLYPIYEVFYLSNEFINNKRDSFLNTIENIFKCTIKREVCGNNYSVLYFYDEKGKCIRKYKITGFFYLKRNCVIEEFPPIYLQYRK
jgi:hypothetical protein